MHRAPGEGDFGSQSLANARRCWHLGWWPLRRARLDQRAIHDIKQALAPGVFANLLDGRGERCFEAWPFIPLENPEMLGGFAPFGDQAWMGTGPRTDPDVSTQVFARNVYAFLGRVDARSDQSVPQFTNRYKQPKGNIYLSSAHRLTPAGKVCRTVWQHRGFYALSIPVMQVARAENVFRCS